MYSIVSIYAAQQVESVRPLASPQYTQPSQLKPECSWDKAICPVKVHYILPSQLKPEWLYLVKVNQASYMQILKLWSELSMPHIIIQLHLFFSVAQSVFACSRFFPCTLPYSFHQCAHLFSISRCHLAQQQNEINAIREKPRDSNITLNSATFV